MKRFYIFSVILLICSSWYFSASAQGQNVTFPDANLAAALRASLGLAPGADIPLTSLQELTDLAPSLLE